MKIWLSKNSEVSLHEQLTRQIMTAIYSGDLQTAEKLPSVREIAIRFKIHQNTVSTAYQWLEENGWVTSRKGSGVFVNKLEKEKRETVKFETENELDVLISKFFRKTQQFGFTNSQIEKGFNKFLSTPKPERILIVEKDEYLRQILFTELEALIDFPLFGLSPSDIKNTNYPPNSIIIAMPETAAELRMISLANTPIVSLKINSALGELKDQQKPNSDELIGIVSGWEMFLRWAKTFLIAIGIEAESIVIRDAREKDFHKGLDSCLFVITDSATACMLSDSLNTRIYHLIPNDFITELNTFMS